MRVLALDTALGACSVAIIDGDKVLGERFEDRTRGHAERLMDMIAEVEDEAGLRARDMDRLAVTVGPGTFTGLRVGLSAARGMALATGLPLIGISTLQAVAANVPSATLGAGELVASVLDCRRGEVYFQVFDSDASELLKPSIATVERAVEKINSIRMKHEGHVYLVGSGTHLVAAIVSKSIVSDQAQPQPVARKIARLAAAIEEPLTSPPDPLYLRKPDAKLPSKNPLGPR